LVSGTPLAEGRGGDSKVSMETRGRTKAFFTGLSRARSTRRGEPRNTSEVLRLGTLDLGSLGSSENRSSGGRMGIGLLVTACL